VHFDAVFNRQKSQIVARSLGHGFNGSIAKWSLQKQCKSYPKVYGQTEGRGSGRTIAPPLNIRYWITVAVFPYTVAMATTTVTSQNCNEHANKNKTSWADAGAP